MKKHTFIIMVGIISATHIIDCRQDPNEQITQHNLPHGNNVQHLDPATVKALKTFYFPTNALPTRKELNQRVKIAFKHIKNRFDNEKDGNNNQLTLAIIDLYKEVKNAYHHLKNLPLAD